MRVFHYVCMFGVRVPICLEIETHVPLDAFVVGDLIIMDSYEPAYRPIHELRCSNSKCKDCGAAPCSKVSSTVYALTWPLIEHSILPDEESLQRLIEPLRMQLEKSHGAPFVQRYTHQRFLATFAEVGQKFDLTHFRSMSDAVQYLTDVMKSDSWSVNATAAYVPPIPSIDHAANANQNRESESRAVNVTSNRLFAFASDVSGDFVNLLIPSMDREQNRKAMKKAKAKK